MNWKKIGIWAGIVVAGLVVLGVIAVVLFLNTNTFHPYVLSKVEKSASSSLGTDVHVGSFDLNLSPTVLQLNNVLVGEGQGQRAPLLQANKIRAGIKIVSLYPFDWRLRSVEVDHPVVHMYVDANGNNNLPKPKSSGNSQTNVFDLAVQRAVLQNGEVYLNDKKNTLDADLHNLHFTSSYDSANGGTYSGDLGYNDGQLRFRDYAPIPHALQAHFDATRSGMQISPVVLTSGPSQLKADINIRGYSNPVIYANYTGDIVSGEFRRILKNASLPQGTIHLNGTLNFHQVPGKSPLQTLTANGTIQSPKLDVTTPKLSTNLTDLFAKYSVKDGNAVVQDVRAHALGGEVTGSATLQNIGEESQKARVQLSGNGISLSGLTPIMGQNMQSTSISPSQLSGKLNANVNAAWGKNTNDLVANIDAQVNADVSPKPGKTKLPEFAPSSTHPVPVNGSIHAHYSAATGNLTLKNSVVKTPQGSVSLSGTVGKGSQLSVKVNSIDLQQLEQLAGSFGSNSPLKTLGLNGKLSFSGTVTGSTSSPHIQGTLVGQNVEVRGARFRLLRAAVNLSPSFASIQNGVAELAPKGQIKFELKADLKKWSLTPTGELQGSVNASNVSAAEISRLAGSSVPVTGNINADLSLHGSKSSPQGQGYLTLANATVGPEPVQKLNVNFNGTGDIVHADLTLSLPAGTATANLQYAPKTQQYQAVLHAPDIKLGQLRTLAKRNKQISGILNLSASGSGSIDDPQGQANLTIPQLTIEGKTISDLRLDAGVQNKTANVVLLSHAVNTAITGRATVNLTGDYEAQGTLDTQRIPLQPLLALYSPAEASDFSGQAEFHASFKGPLKDKSRLQAQFEIPALSIQYKAVQLGEVQPIRGQYAGGVLTVQPAEIRGTGTDLRLRGAIPLATAQPASFALLGTVDLRLMQLFDPTLDSSGRLQFDINTFGDRSNLNTQGQIKIENASFSTATSPIGLNNANGILSFQNDRLEVKQFQAQLGGGDLTASGAITVRPSVQFNLALEANGVRVPYPQGVRTSLDSKITLTGTTDSSLLRGTARINNIYFAPDFDPTSALGEFGGAPAPPSTGGFTQNLKLNVAVQSGPMLNATSRTFSIKGAVNLRLTGTADQPVVLGRVDLNGGDALVFGNRYLIKNSTIAFVNAIQTEPVLNVEASTTIDQYNIQLRLQGPTDRLRTTYTSDPSLPPVDIIHLLAFGSTTESAGANPTPGNLGAEAVLAQGVANQVTSRLQKVAGISHLSIDPTLGSGNQTNPGARISVQQRVTSNLFVTFETDVTSIQHDVIQLQYQLNPRWSVSTTRDQNGGFAFDVRNHRTF